MDKNNPKHIPIVVSQALAWLDKMRVTYHYIPDSGLWVFEYEGLDLLLWNDVNENEFGLYAPVLITDSDDEEICKMVYECSVSVIEMELSSNCDFGYDGNGLCHVAQWWGIESTKPRLTRKVFEEKLKEMHDCQLKLHFILHCTYESMFNPPAEVVDEILKHNTITDENDKI